MNGKFEKLEKALDWMVWIQQRNECSCEPNARCVKCVVTDDIAEFNQALALERSKPEAGELTKHLREQVIYIAEMVKGKHPDEEIDWPEMFEQINVACTLLDSKDIELKAKDEELEKMKEAYDIRYGDLQRQEKLIENLTAKIDDWEGAILEPLQEKFKALSDENIVLNEEIEERKKTIINLRKALQKIAGQFSDYVKKGHL